jgi:hypothetical protein
MLEITGASAQTTAAPDAAPLPSAAGAAPSTRSSGGRCQGGRADGVQPNWWNGTQPSTTPSITPDQSQNGGIIGALQALIGAFGNAVQSGMRQFLGAPPVTASGTTPANNPLRSPMDESRPL